MPVHLLFLFLINTYIGISFLFYQNNFISCSDDEVKCNIEKTPTYKPILDHMCLDHIAGKKRKRDEKAAEKVQKDFGIFADGRIVRHFEVSKIRISFDIVR